MLSFMTTIYRPGILISVAAGSLAFSLITLLIALISSGSVRRLKRRYRQLVRNQEGVDLEDLMKTIHQENEALQNQVRMLARQVESHEMRLKSKVSSVQLFRYNAFREPGNDLSFSLSLIDEEGRGAVLSSIYGREDSRVYAKPLEEGASTYTLTDEEREVIARTMKQSAEAGSGIPKHLIPKSTG